MGWKSLTFQIGLPLNGTVYLQEYVQISEKQLVAARPQSNSEFKGAAFKSDYE